MHRVHSTKMSPPQHKYTQIERWFKALNDISITDKLLIRRNPAVLTWSGEEESAVRCKGKGQRCCSVSNNGGTSVKICGKTKVHTYQSPGLGCTCKLISLITSGRNGVALITSHEKNSPPTPPKINWDIRSYLIGRAAGEDKLSIMLHHFPRCH